MTDATCDCGRPILWTTLDTGSRMPLDPLPMQFVAPRLVAFNPRKQTGHVIRDEDLDQVETWRTAGATVHRSHFATCPNAAQHRRQR